MIRRTTFLLLALGGVALSTVPIGARADTTSGEAPLRVAFKCSQANVALYQWQFNYDGTTFLPDSSSDTSGDITYVYTEPGTYFARVQWFDATSGAVDGETVGPILVKSPPKPPVVSSSFGPLPVSIVVGTEMHPVTFTASAVASDARSIVSYTWDIHGDGAVDASTPGGPSSSLSMSYSVAGYYTYTVTAVDDGGLAGIDRQTVRVGAPPSVRIALDPGVLPGELLTADPTLFNLSIAPSVVSTLVSAQINFGDGTLLALASDATTASHAYAAPGSYTVTLSATDDMGFSATTTQAVTVRNPPIVTRVDAGGKMTQTNQFPGTFFANARTTAPATISGYSWSIYSLLNNGTLTLLGTTTSAGGPSSSAGFVFSGPGRYRCTVQASDSVGRISPPASDDFVISTSGNFTKPSPPPPKVVLASVEETGSVDRREALDLQAVLPYTVRVGHKVTFRVAGQQGQYPLANFGWDLDGDRLLDVVDGIGTGKANATSVQTYQYETPGYYYVECAVGDQNPDRSSAILARMRFLITVLPVRPGDTGLQGWITQPREGRRVWGNHLTVKARTSPASQTRQVEFQYRATGSAGWTTIGTAVPPPYVSISVPWDVTSLPPGPYQLRALSSDQAGNPAYSSEAIALVNVTVDPVNPEQEETSDVAGLPLYRNETVVPSQPTTTEVGGNTSIEIPPHGARLPPTVASLYFRMRMSFQENDPHPLETKFQKLRFVPGTFRSLSLSDGATLAEPSRVSMYNTRQSVTSYLNSLGFTGRSSENPKLTIYQFDDRSARWVPLFAQVQRPQEDLVRASTVSMGDIALAVDLHEREKSSSSESACGLLGLEALAILLLARGVLKKHASFS